MQYIIGICDDETLQLKINNIYIKEIAARNHINVIVKAFNNSSQLFTYLQKEPLDILYLDIELGEESGIEIAEKLTGRYPNIIVVFITGHREYTNQAFDVEALGYIVKPVDEHKLERNMKKVLTQVYGIKTRLSGSSLVVTEENIKKKIIQSDIIYIERLQTKSIIHTKTRNYQVYEPITSLCERLEKNFLRLNQSEVVNSKEILKIEGNTVFLRNGMQLTIGRTYKKTVIQSYLG